jgi:hypothetical protein
VLIVAPSTVFLSLGSNVFPGIKKMSRDKYNNNGFINRRNKKQRRVKSRFGFKRKTIPLLLSGFFHLIKAIEDAEVELFMPQ